MQDKDGDIINALVGNRTVSEAAAEVGISRATIYNRMKESDFMEAYEAAKKAHEIAAQTAITNATVRAMETLLDILEDEGGGLLDTAPTYKERIAAAEAIINANKAIKKEPR